MTRFLTRLLLFFSVLIAGATWLFSVPLDKEFAYHFLKNDCYGHGKWLYDRMFHHEKDIDIAFLGTSRTIQAIDESYLEKSLFVSDSLLFGIANLGYCRPGRNLHSVLLNDLLENKTTKLVVLEVREDEDRYSHPAFPVLARQEEVFGAPLLFNRDLFSDDFLALSTRFEAHRQKLLGISTQDYSIDLSPFGYGGATKEASTEELEEIRERRQSNKRDLNSWQRDFYMKYPRSYLKKIHQQCESKGVQLVFLYLPGYGSPVPEPLEISTYRKYGKVLIPPMEMFDPPERWMDADHMNKKGATAMGDWLNGEIRKLLKE